MSNQLISEEVVIGELTFTIRALPYVEGSKLLSRVRKYFPFFTDEDSAAIGPMFMLTLSDRLDEADREAMVNAFGPHTTVALPDGNHPTLKMPEKRALAFGVAYENELEWLGHCLKLNFGGMIEKTKAALAYANQQREAAAKAEPNASEGTSSSPTA